MTAPRLPFLWPFLFAPRSVAPHAATRQVRRHLQTASTRRQGTTTQRYGTANEPILAPSPEPPSIGDQREGTVIDVKALSRRAKKDKPRKAESPAQIQAEQAEPPDLRPSHAAQHKPTENQDRSTREHDPIADTAPSILTLARPHGKAGEQDPPRKPAPPEDSTTKKPPDSVLDTPPSDSLEMATIPGQVPDSSHRAPHMNTPPYVHHFDTYSLVQSLESGTWTRDQAITIMKAVRQILFENMTLATEALVSKSNVENETYLFRAACSELKTEISAKRKSETEKSGTQRTQLMHEVDILSQKLDQQSMWLKDELKGMFDDRKMAVRNEQRAMESRIQQLNYRITVALNSDSRSDVEGVRWIITKRAIAAIVICVIMVASSLKYSSVIAQAEEEARRRHAEKQRINHEESSRNSGPKSGGSAREGHESFVDPGRRNHGDGSGDAHRGDRRVYVGEVLVKEGDNPSFVSLG